MKSQHKCTQASKPFYLKLSTQYKNRFNYIEYRNKTIKLNYFTQFSIYKGLIPLNILKYSKYESLFSKLVSDEYNFSLSNTL